MFGELWFLRYETKYGFIKAHTYTLPKTSVNRIPPITVRMLLIDGVLIFLFFGSFIFFIFVRKEIL